MTTLFALIILAVTPDPAKLKELQDQRAKIDAQIAALTADPVPAPAVDIVALANLVKSDSAAYASAATALASANKAVDSASTALDSAKKKLDDDKAALAAALGLVPPTPAPPVPTPPGPNPPDPTQTAKLLVIEQPANCPACVNFDAKVLPFLTAAGVEVTKINATDPAALKVYPESAMIPRFVATKPDGTIIKKVNDDPTFNPDLFKAWIGVK